MPYNKRKETGKPKNEKGTTLTEKKPTHAKEKMTESSIYQLVTMVQSELFPSLLSELLLLFCVGTNSGASPRSFDAIPLSPSLTVAVLSVFTASTIPLSGFGPTKLWSQQGGSYCYKNKVSYVSEQETTKTKKGE